MLVFQSALPVRHRLKPHAVCPVVAMLSEVVPRRAIPPALGPGILTTVRLAIGAQVTPSAVLPPRREDRLVRRTGRAGGVPAGEIRPAVMPQVTRNVYIEIVGAGAA